MKGVASATICAQELKSKDPRSQLRGIYQTPRRGLCPIQAETSFGVLNPPGIKPALAVPVFRLALRNDLHAFQGHPLDRGAFLAAAAGLGGDVGYALQHIIPGGEFAESGVLVVEKFGLSVTKEKLRAGGIGVGRTRH